MQTGEGDNEKGSVVPARPIGRIRPSTPAWDALKSGTIEAQFEVAADGKTVVTLLQKTGNEEADRQVLEYLQTIKWLPKTVHGVPTSDVRTGTFQREG